MPRLSYDDFTPWQQNTLIRMAKKLLREAESDPVLWARVQAQKEMLYQTGRLQRPEPENEEGVVAL